jgi:hypothetical protein
VVHQILLELSERIKSNPAALPYLILDKCTAVLKTMKHSPSTIIDSQGNVESSRDWKELTKEGGIMNSMGMKREWGKYSFFI